MGSWELREDITRECTFAFGHCPNQLNPPLPSPQFGQLGHLFSGCFARMTVKSTIDYNNGCNDHSNSTDGNFYDNDDKKHTNIISFE